MESFLVFDIETHFDEKKARFLENIPKEPTTQDAYNFLKDKYAREATIQKHLDETTELLIRKHKTSLKRLHVKPQLQNIKLINIKQWHPESPKFYCLENPNNDFKIEKEIIEKTWSILVSSNQWISYNGCMFDIPVMLNRAISLKANINLRHLMEQQNKFSKQHLDLTRYFTGSLDYNLRNLFGVGKDNINFDTCSFEKLKEYSLNEINLLYSLASRLLGYDENY